jgi:xanthine permease
MATINRPEDEKLAPAGLVSFGLQHILSMFGGVIAVPIIIGGAAGLKADQRALLISCSLFISGVATILQSLGVPYFGSQLPLVQGISFASVATLLAIIAGKGTDGLRGAYGACIVAGVVALVVVPFFAQVIRFFPPVVTGSVITVIGLSLMPVAGGWIAGQATITVNGVARPNPDFASPKNIALAVVTLLICLGLSKIKKIARMAILSSLVLGTIVAFVTGQAKYTSGGSALAFPRPLAFGAPTFAVGAIVSMFIVMIVIMVETTADIIAVGEVVGTDVPAHRVANGLRADMLSSVVAPVFNTFPATGFAQNVGLVALTGIKSRFAVATGGGILAVLGLSPWLAGVIGVIPSPVLGGVGIALFGSVAASGVRTLSKVSYDRNNNLIIVAVSIAFGTLPVVVPGFWGQFPDWFHVIFQSGISACAIVAFLLNIWFNMIGKGPDSSVAALTAHAPARAVTAEQVDGLDAPAPAAVDSTS